jgi:2-amino-4-hydroxy-6-hydroxymethyldihydropteridine diphosphokinase
MRARDGKAAKQPSLARQVQIVRPEAALAGSRLAPVTAFIGLGANLGPREETLRRALELLAAEQGVEVVAVSRYRETDPVGVVDQPPFVNAAAAVETSLEPRELLDTLLGIEQELGRARDGTRWGPRTVDLDLLVYADEIVDDPGLRVPHPRLHERRFALEPLAELAPDLVVPGYGPVSELLAHLD